MKVKRRAVLFLAINACFRLVSKSAFLNLFLTGVTNSEDFVSNLSDSKVGNFILKLLETSH